MKKRIVSLFLVIAMVVAVIPAIALPALAAANDYTDGYDTTVTSDILTVDGLCDDAYLRSEKIVSNYKSATNEDNDFVAYTAANAQGLYVWVAVEDTTLVHREDRLAVYFNFRAVHTTDGTDTLQDSYMVVQLRPIDATPFTASGCLAIGDIQTALVKAEGVGYSAEYFIPWQKIADKVGAKGTSALPCSVGFEAQDYTAEGTRISYSGDTNKVGTYYNKVYTFNKLNYVMEEDTPEFKIAGSKDRMGAYSSTAITVDGAMDAVYANGTKITFDAIGSEKDANDYAYVAFTDSDIYVYINMNDTTNDASKDFIQVYHRFHTRLSANGLYYTSGYYRFARDNSTATNNHYNGHIPEALDLKGMGAIEYKLVDNPGVGYTIEIKYPMTAAEKALISNTSTGMSFDLCFEAHNGTGSTYNSDCAAGSWVRAYMSSQIIPSIHLVKDVASYAVQPKITGANLSLGEAFRINCYATLSPMDADAQMRVTFNDDVYLLNAKKTDVKNEYMFIFDEIPPQCIGDNIKAELLIDGKVATSIDNYSVLINCKNLLASNDTTAETKQLIYDLLAYGAAAQKYAKYKTDALVNMGYEALATSVTSITNNDRKYSPATISGAKFSAAGVYYAGVNKVYAKIEIDGADVSKLKATVNGKVTAIEHYRDNEYIVYSDSIKVSEFDNVYTFIIHDGKDSQTLFYSINAYAKAKMDADNAATAELAKATYAYGQSAKAYVKSLNGVNITNLYDKSKAFAGYVDGNNVEKASSVNYTSAYISVTPGEKIYFGPCKVSQDFQLHGYDSSKAISHKYVGLEDKSVFTVEATFDNGLVIYSYVIPANTAYVRIANPSAYNDVYMISKTPIDLVSFKEYWGEGNTLDLYLMYDKYTSDAFTGKTVLFLGDSICAANCESGKIYQGWSGRIQIATGMTCTNKGVSGASISTSRGENVVYNHYSTVRNNNYDFIIMHGGVNDAWDKVSIGVMTDSFDPKDFDDTTYAGGLEKLFYYVKTEHPDAKLGYIFNFATPSYNTGNIADMGGYYVVAKKICEKWNIPFLNMYEDDSLTAALKTNTTTYLSDRLHPNTAGYDILYPYIMYWMETLPVNSSIEDGYDLETLPSEVAK